MRSISLKPLVKTVGCLLIAVIGGFASFAFLILFFIALGLFGWSDGSGVQDFVKLSESTIVTGIIAFLVAIIVTIYLVIVMTVEKKKIRWKADFYDY
jgi:hypothetical protein